MKKVITFLYLQNKRLFKRPGFVIIFLFVPVLVLLMTKAAKLDSSVMKIAVFSGNDEKAVQAVEALESPESVISFIMTNSENDAINLVKDGEADAAWVFEEGYSDKIAQCIKTGVTDTLVTSWQPEDNPLLSLAMFRLNVVMYPEFMHEAYLHYTDSVMVTDAFSEKELEYFYENNRQDISLFEMHYLDEEEIVRENADYLVAPLRGLLALWLMLTAFAATLYYINDEKHGRFEWIPLRYRDILNFTYLAIPVFDAAVVMLITLYITGINVSLGRELLNILILSLNGIMMSYMLRSILKTEARFAAAVPVVMLIMTVLCPVFITVKDLRFVQFLLPPFYYLNATHAWVYTGLGATLFAAYACVNIVLSLLHER